MNRKHLKSALVNTFKIGFAVALIYWLISSGRFDLNVLSPLLSVQFVLAALLLFAAVATCASERWRALLNAQDFSMGFFETLKLTFIGLFFNFAMPGGVGGDLIKGYYVVRSQSQRKFDSAMTVLMDRVFGLYVMVLMAAASVVFGFDSLWNHSKLQILVWIVGFVFLAFTVGLAVGFSSRFKKWAEVFANKFLPNLGVVQRIFQVWQGLIRYRQNPMTLVKVLLLSLLTQSLVLVFFRLAGNQMGYEAVPISVYFISCLVGTMITAIPVSPAGIGVGQAAFAFLFSELAGNDAAKLGSGLATAAQACQFVLGLAGAWFYIQIKHHPHPTDLQSTVAPIHNQGKT